MSSLITIDTTLISHTQDPLSVICSIIWVKVVSEKNSNPGISEFVLCRKLQRIFFWFQEGNS